MLRRILVMILLALIVAAGILILFLIMLLDTIRRLPGQSPASLKRAWIRTFEERENSNLLLSLRKARTRRRTSQSASDMLRDLALRSAMHFVSFEEDPKEKDGDDTVDRLVGTLRRRGVSEQKIELFLN